MTSLAMAVALLLGPLTQGGLGVREAWVRQTSAARTVSSGYFRIDNDTSSPVALVRVAVDGARSAELHTLVEDHGRTVMKPLARLPIPARSSVTLAPGGTHVMLTGVAPPFRAGTTVRMTLTFDNRQTRRVQAIVRPLDATAAR